MAPSLVMVYVEPAIRLISGILPMKADKIGRRGKSAAVRVLLGGTLIGNQRWAVKAHFSPPISFTRRFSRPSTGVPTVTTNEPSFATVSA